MAEICRFLGIEIWMYFDEHNPLLSLRSIIISVTKTDYSGDFACSLMMANAGWRIYRIWTAIFTLITLYGLITKSVVFCITQCRQWSPVDPDFYGTTRSPVSIFKN